MKKFTLLVSMLTLTFLSNAAVIIDETFNYSVANLADETSTWTNTGTITTGTGRNIESGGLVYSNTGGTYIFSGVGNKINQDYSAGSNYIAYRPFDAITTGAIYISYLYQANGNQGQTASEVLGLSNSTTNSAVKLWAGKQADQTKNPFRLGITRSSTSSGDIQWSSNTYNADEVYLIVIKYDFATTTASLFVNPVLGTTTEPTADVSADSDGTARTSLGYLMFKHNGASYAKFLVSGVRVSTSWTEATAIQSNAPQLSAPVVGTPTSATETGFTANWTPVSNAIGYDVKVYLGTNLISTTNVEGQASSSAEITGLMSGMSYTYQVIAIGDVTNYNDSDPSASSTEITTLDPYATNALNTDFNDGTWGEIATSQPSAGTYPSYSVNGFELNSATFYAGSARGIKGEYHVNRIVMDKVTYGGSISLPTINAMQQIEIHATAGTAGNGFQLKEFNQTTNSWDALGDTYVYEAGTKAAGTDSIYIISLQRTTPTKLKIENPTTGGVYIYQIISRNTNPVLLNKPVVSAASNATTTGFTVNWSAVANATGYKIWIYKGSSNITTVDVDGQATESQAVTGLQSDSTYTYKVQAIGDGDIDYSDSFLSAESSSVTTLHDINTAVGQYSENLIIFAKNKKVICSESGNIQIFNIQGSQIISVEDAKSVNTNLSSGLYIVKFTNHSGTRKIQKITIQ
ncbi:MAG: T9SS type A sorting domain-containing protein [Paludibacter sp.]|nr:T9SS type A sorting domain-containing protein [Paludibacter sp.]